MSKPPKDGAMVAPQHQPPKPFADDSAKNQSLVMAAYALRPARPAPEVRDDDHDDHDAHATTLAGQVLALQPPQSPTPDPEAFKNRLADVMRNL
ncbi:MAG: hypothetical protein HQM02_03250 [Magnetococcales bacterium]|nr:hypothetical protein [Magnetococcales bacterium]